MNIIKKIIILFYSVRYTLHYLFFMCSKNKHLIKEDLYEREKHYKSKMKIFPLFVTCMRDRYFRSLFFYRLGKISKCISWLTRQDVTYIIDENCIMGGGVYNPHSYATIIHAKKIGKNFSHRQCTTIGNKIDGRNDLIPTIGDNVTLGANVVIIGNVYIGNNVIVGAGSVITKDVPDNTIIVGNPSRIIRHAE